MSFPGLCLFGSGVHVGCYRLLENELAVLTYNWAWTLELTTYDQSRLILVMLACLNGESLNSKQPTA
jgi:hypothetical protein